METYAIIVYVFSDEVLHILGVETDPQSKMSDAEVIKRIESIKESVFWSLIT